jgi:hypothetical protein
MSSLLSQTYDDVQAVTPSDTVDDPAGVFAGLLVLRTGTLQIITRAGTTILLDSVAAGQTIPVTVKRVMATNTTALVVGLRGAPFYSIKS